MKTMTPELAQRFKVLQIIGFALPLGVVVFAVVAAVLGPVGQQPADPAMLNMLRLACVALIVGTVPIALVLRRAMISQLAQREADDMQIMNAFTNATILAIALAEGPALFGAVVLLLSGTPSDIVLVALPLIGMLWHMPTRSRWEKFVDSVHQQKTRM